MSAPFLLPSTFNLMPISPPAPHRRAPRPPHYTPRHSRPRHIRMKEPAQMGLFTVSEVDEFPISASGYNSAADCLSVSGYSMASACSSSDCLPSSDDGLPSDFPRDVESESSDFESHDSDIIMSDRHSWNSITSSITSGTNSAQARTPNSESEDPFAFECMLGFGMSEDVSVFEDDEDDFGSIPPPLPIRARVSGLISRGRRPPPLSLVSNSSFKQHPYRSSTSPLSPNAPTPRSRSIQQDALLPAINIVSPTSSRRRSSASTSPSTPTFDRCQPTSAPVSTSTMIANLVKGHHRRRSSDKPVKPKSPDDDVDLISALQDLLSTCGERVEIDSDSSCPPSSDDDEYMDRRVDQRLQASQLSFPLPPTRLPPFPSLSYSPTSPLSSASDTIQTPRTPLRRTIPQIPATPARRRSSDPRDEISYELRGDHSFLKSLSSGNDYPSPPMSASSWSSGSKSSRSSGCGRGLPKRKELPTDWRDLGRAL